jgi:alpha-glucosidase
VTQTNLGWWTDAVVYQIYPRSFCDGNGDGVGDIAGMISKLPYLAELGVDAIWVSPWYPSPMADGGYDVSDYCGIHPDFGTLADADAFVAGAHERGIKVLIDLVPNHTSSAYPWFAAALMSAPGSPERARYHFLDGKGPGGDLPPTNWGCLFGGSAWTRITEADGRPGQWYLHMFDVSQPDLNWTNPDVVEMFDDVLRFWFDRGIDGFRIDVADSLHKDMNYPDTRPGPNGLGSVMPASDHPMWDQPALADVQRRWRAIADSYPGGRVFVSEANCPERLAFLTPERLHTTFTFDSVFCSWDAASQRHMIDHNLRIHDAVGAGTTWVMGNHDQTRPVTRYGKRITGWQVPESGVTPMEDRVWAEFLYPWPTDVETGRRRARALVLLYLALPGGMYIYQGEELGLDEVEDLPIDRLQDPSFARTNGRTRGRDGCRVPLPWSGTQAPFGFSPRPDAEPWLPQPAHWAALTAEAEDGDRTSTLELYRAALRTRHSHPALGAGAMAWDDRYPRETVVAFTRKPGFGCVVNIGQDAVELPAGARVLVASGPIGDVGLVPAETTVWYQA